MTSSSLFDDNKHLSTYTILNWIEKHILSRFKFKEIERRKGKHLAVRNACFKPIYVMECTRNLNLKHFYAFWSLLLTLSIVIWARLG